MPGPLLRSILSHLCLFHWLTGLQCPLCGMTHAMLALARGDWRAALHYNALSPLAAVMLATLFWNHPWRGRLWTAGIAAFGVYGIWRLVAGLAAG
jgi:Protein of unknown function (DUF2752)